MHACVCVPGYRYVADTAPELINKLIILNAPHVSYVHTHTHTHTHTPMAVVMGISLNL